MARKAWNRKGLIRQPFYRGGRLHVGSAFIPDLEKAVLKEMRNFNASRSFVIATCVAYALGVEEQADYRKILAPVKRKVG